MPKYALYWKKRKKSKFNRFQIEVFFLPSTPPPREYSPIKFVLCPYIRLGRINRKSHQKESPKTTNDDGITEHQLYTYGQIHEALFVY